MVFADKHLTDCDIFLQTITICTYLWLFLWFWQHGVVVITTAQLHLTKSKLRFCAGSNSTRNFLEIRSSEDLWQWPPLEIRLNAFRRSTTLQKQFIIIITMRYSAKINTGFLVTSCEYWRLAKCFFKINYK